MNARCVPVAAAIPRLRWAFAQLCVGPSASTTQPRGCHGGSTASKTTTISSAHRHDRSVRRSVGRFEVPTITVMRVDRPCLLRVSTSGDARRFLRARLLPGRLPWREQTDERGDDPDGSDGERKLVLRRLRQRMHEEDEPCDRSRARAPTAVPRGRRMASATIASPIHRNDRGHLKLAVPPFEASQTFESRAGSCAFQSRIVSTSSV